MRRFFVQNLERLLNVLVVLAALAVIALAVQTALDAGGDRRMWLQALAILLGGLTALLTIGGVGYLAISMNAHLARIASGERAERQPMAANRGHVAAAIAVAEEPKEIRRAPRPAAPLAAPGPVHAEPVATKKREAEPAPHRSEPVLARRAEPVPEPELYEEIELQEPLEDPVSEPVRPVFTGRSMPRLTRDEPAAHMEKAQDEPAPSHPVFRGSRLVADPRPRR